jgi:hypothetical protein
MRKPWLLLPVLLATLSLEGATYFVDGAKGSDGAAGTSAEDAFKTIQRAADRVAPGDTVIIAPGIYYEQVQCRGAGTALEGIVFKADRVEKGRVVISGAVRDIREGKVAWQVEDAAAGLYSVPLAYRPSRVLYDGIDLPVYPDLETLRDFRFQGGYPGIKHGFTQVDGRLYVRLRQDGKYGSPDPGKHTVCVSPPNGTEGHAAHFVTRPEHYNFAVLTQAPARVTLDGLTFETPGVAGVYVDGSHVRVQNCWFVGCRFGVSGYAVWQDHDLRVGGEVQERMTDHVIVEHCDYSQFPAFDDMLDVINEYREDPWRGDQKKFEQKVFWWQRKGGQDNGIDYKWTWETGLVGCVGESWTIRNNYLHDALEGISTFGVDRGRSCRIYNNRFERLIDNAVEAENHAEDLRVYENEVVDVFEPFSWQPLQGMPWPGPVYIYRNLVRITPERRGLWSGAGWKPGVFKLGAEEKNWKWAYLGLKDSDAVRAPGEGFLAFNNTLHCPGSYVLTLTQSDKRAFENFRVFNNLVVADGLARRPGFMDGGIAFEANVAAFLEPGQPGQAERFTANGGKLLAAEPDLAWSGEVLGEGSPARGVRASESPAEALPDAGAVPYGQSWPKFVVGPRSSSE